MPWTFAHPAAVLPLRRLCPRWLHFPALLLGCLTPDFGYYVRAWNFSIASHDFPAGLPGCVAAGFLLLMAFYALRRPVCHLLPQPHRGALLRACEPVHLSKALLLTMTVSLVIGATTHIAWDAFTHRGGWFVMQVPVLQATAMHIGNNAVPVYDMLQHMSTLAGSTALAWAYWRWLRGARTPAEASPAADNWRYLTLFTLIAVSALTALLLALPTATQLHGRIVLQSLVFHFAVNVAVVFALLVTASALLLRVTSVEKHRK